MKKIQKTGIICTAFIVCLLVISGCNKESRDASLQKILDSGELVLGLDSNFPPMGFVDENGEITGFDIDLAEETCRRMGVKLVKKPINWEDKEKELNNGNIDCIWNGLSMSSSRDEEMSLSEPYMKNDLIFAVSNDSGIKTLKDLKGKKVGVQSGSIAETSIAASKISSDIIMVKEADNVHLFNMLEEGFLDSVYMDSVFAYYYISENNKNYYILPTVLETGNYVIGFRKNDTALRDRVQEVLLEINADGTLKEISTKWFGTDVTTVR